MCYQCSSDGCGCLCVFTDASTIYTIYIPTDKVCMFCGHWRNYKANNCLAAGSDNTLQYINQKVSE